ncbi:MAG: hypothetical protein LBJ21_10240, partial [Acidobacteriota bacterium]|nr:hypothetical protein [Acidobacteriota bacterium]
MKTEATYYFPWIRKGISNRIEDVDALGDVKNDKQPNRQRSILSINAEYGITPPVDKDAQKEEIPIFETKEVEFIGPGDIVSVSSEAILKVTPKVGSAGFPVQFYPYIEFWEPDFPWRYTPARPNGERLRPWLALLVCETTLCSIYRLSDGRAYAALRVSEEAQYRAIFPSPKDTWKSAHAQGAADGEPGLSRLLASRRPDNNEAAKLSEKKDYYALLVPAFETGRLRGLGYDDEALQGIAAQAPAWEESLDGQKNKHPKQPLDFPVYYHWTFKTGEDSFDGLVSKLKIAGGFDADIKIDVSRMGEGLDYDLFDQAPARDVIGMPAAAQPLGLGQKKKEPFPRNSGDEGEIYRRFKDLVSKSPVFLENRTEINGGAAGAEAGDDDPWVVPPVYGGKHIMAASVDEAANETSGTPWLSQLNLDIHYRAAAGLGRRTVQTHQEEFVNRAWKQVEAVNALNHELRQRLLSVNVNRSLKNKKFRSSRFENGRIVRPKEKTGSDFIAGMIRNFSSMKNARVKSEDGKSAPSLSSILAESNIPQAFASASFQRLTDDIAKLTKNLNASSVMDNIANNQIFGMPEHVISNTPDIKLLRKATDNIYLVLLGKICASLSRYFDIAVNKNYPNCRLDELYQLKAKKTTNRNDYKYCGFHSRSEETLQIAMQEFKSLASPYILVLDESEYENLFGAGGNFIVTKMGLKEPCYFI